MKKIVQLFSLYTFFLTNNPSYSQTNVSGGIFSNTTWTKANSPYIVTDTVVVFPGVTLTIQSGVTVKFNSNVMLEIRQAQLIAVGAISDSITFTANTSSPSPGFWRKVHVNGGNLVSQFKYCNFKFAGQGLYASINYTLSNSDFYYNSYGLYGGSASPIDSCNFRYNVYYSVVGGGTYNYCNILNTQQRGMTGGGLILNNCILDSNQFGIYGLEYSRLNNCFFRFNQTGIAAGGNGYNFIKNTIFESNSSVGIDIISGDNDTIVDCLIIDNGIGLKVGGGSQDPSLITLNVIENNNIGVQVFSPGDSIYCNRICNNTSYGLQSMTSSNLFLENNYWCTSDSIATAAVIYDAFDNVSLGFVYFMPIDSLCAPSNPTSIDEIKSLSINIFPNPASDFLNISLEENKTAEIKIYNLLGGEILNMTIKESQNKVNVSELPSGVYVLKVFCGNNITRQKFIISKQ